MLVAWRGHTPDSALLAESIREAMRTCYGSEKAAAHAMGLTPPELSRQLSGLDPLNAFRAAPREFARVWMRIHLQKLGDSVITAQERDLILGFVGMGRARMARMLAWETRRKETA